MLSGIPHTGVVGAMASVYIPLVDLPVTSKDAQQPVKETYPRPPKINPPRWKSLEFIFYYIVIGIGVVVLVRAAVSFSSDDNPNFSNFYHKLRPGWIFGREIDNSDAQYRGFRDKLPLALAAFAGYIALNRSVLAVMSKHKVAPRARFAFRASLCVLGIVGLHGFNSIKIFAILAANYVLGKAAAGKRFASLFIWVFALFVLFGLEKFKWRWETLGLGFLDCWNGLVQRWDITFNLAVLRLISYNVDYHYSRIEATDFAVLKHQSACEACKSGDCEKFRSMSSPEASNYNVFSYLAYVLYLPLFIAGPILSFNNFASQTERQTPRINKFYIIVYAMRLIVTFLVFEAMMHYMWVVAIKDTGSWNGFSPIEFSALGIFNLFIVWFKLLIIWRTFRLIALLDGIEAPENMERCIANNYSGFGFWRGWHRSFNLWIIRYMYIPMGGSSTSAWNVWPIFTFVALWHDFELKMLVWGWLIALFLLPELVGSWWAKRVDLERHPYYRHICAAGGALNLFQVTLCNMLGFALGISGTKVMLRRLFAWDQIPFIFYLALIYFAVVQVAFEVREDEKRRGIFRNY